MPWQNAEVKLHILSVRRRVANGARVDVIDGGGSVHLPDDQNITFFKNGGVYAVHLLVDPHEGTAAQGFTRHGG